jgi:UDP-N-acetylmuramate dehydrogenase
MNNNQKLIKILGGDLVRLNESLARHTTFKIGGPADLFFVAKTTKDLKKAVLSAKKIKIPFFLLGRGSNILVSDKGFRGLVIKNETSQIKISGKRVEADSGVLTSRLVKKTLEKSLSGLESFYGLPGTVGGAVSGSAHFQGKHITELVEKTKKVNGVIVSVIFKLKLGDKKKLDGTVKKAWHYRQASQPLNFPSAGCIFKNPENQSAGYLIDQCGLKGKKMGGAKVSQKHANFIVNMGGATCRDVLALAAICKRKVKEKFGIKLAEEIIIVGEFDG